MKQCRWTATVSVLLLLAIQVGTGAWHGPTR